jgi:hypothetical protein
MKGMNRLTLDKVLISLLDQESLQQERALLEAQTHYLHAGLERPMGAVSKRFPKTEAGLPE